jgi:hypothetical protein
LDLGHPILCNCLILNGINAFWSSFRTASPGACCTSIGFGLWAWGLYGQVANTKFLICGMAMTLFLACRNSLALFYICLSPHQEGRWTTLNLRDIYRTFSSFSLSPHISFFVLCHLIFHLIFHLISHLISHLYFLISLLLSPFSLLLNMNHYSHFRNLMISCSRLIHHWIHPFHPNFIILMAIRTLSKLFPFSVFT